MSDKTFTKGDRVNVYVRSGQWSSAFYTGVVDSMTPSGKQVRVTLRGASKPDNHAVSSVTLMTDHEIAVDDWNRARPRTETLAMRGNRGDAERCEVRSGTILLDAAHLAAVRDDLDALIAWVAKRPVRP